MSALKLGVYVPYSDARNAANLALRAEEAGWDGFFVGDAVWCVDPIVALTASAMLTRRIHLGTMVIPMPLRRPWKVASETAALDNLSGGRLILGLGMGAVWMGWQGFPDEVTDTRARAGMLDEGIDILTLLYRRKQFDYDGKHYHLKLTLVNEMHYPPPPVQQPRIPLWVVAVWPRMKSMKRVLKCDGLIPAKMDRAGRFVEVLPADVKEMKAYVDANRTLPTSFDIVVEGRTVGLDRAQVRDKLRPWVESGATWWIESLEGGDQTTERIEQGPPQLD